MDSQLFSGLNLLNMLNCKIFAVRFKTNHKFEVKLHDTESGKWHGEKPTILFLLQLNVIGMGDSWTLRVSTKEKKNLAS